MAGVSLLIYILLDIYPDAYYYDEVNVSLRRHLGDIFA